MGALPAEPMWIREEEARVVSQPRALDAVVTCRDDGAEESEQAASIRSTSQSLIHIGPLRHTRTRHDTDVRSDSAQQAFPARVHSKSSLPAVLANSDKDATLKFPRRI